MANVNVTFQVPDVLAAMLQPDTDNKSNQVIFIDSDQAFDLLKSVLCLSASQKVRNAITRALCDD